MNPLAALADPTRMAIVELLAKRDLAAGEIGAHFTISAPAVSRHLRILREAGLVSVRIDAQQRIYSLNPRPLAEIGLWAERQQRFAHARLDALGRHLDATDPRRARKAKRHERIPR